MTDTLITLGCSFTYGEGLAYELIKEKYKLTYENLKKIPANKINGDMFFFTERVKEFDEYRIKNNYSNILKNLLGVNLISNGQNGGRNIERLIDLDRIINFLEVEKEMVPKYMVFQLTHIGRDIEDILVPNDRTEDYIKRTYGNDFINRVKELDNGKKYAWNLNSLFDEALKIFVKNLEIRFEKMEKQFNTKCVYFFGLGDVFLIGESYNHFLSSKYFLELKKDNITYMTINELNQHLNWNLKSTIDINDDHPSSISHKWLAHELFKKLQ